VDLKLPPMHPLAVYTADGKFNGRVQLIRESNINAALQSAAKTVYNITKQEELSVQKLVSSITMKTIVGLLLLSLVCLLRL
jgi:hypothetical protein